MKHLITGIVLLAALMTVGATVGVITLSKRLPADPRPQAGTIACRDAQIEQMRGMVVNTQHDPFSTDYSRANDAVAGVLADAEQLQKVCR